METIMKKVHQLSVFAENKPGKIEKITRILTREKINMRAITIASSNKYGVIKLLVNDPEKAYQSLKKEGLSVALNPALAIEIEDKPGGLHRIVQVMKKYKINIENACGFVIKSGEKAVLIIEVKDIEEVENVLSNGNIHFLSENDLYEI